MLLIFLGGSKSRKWLTISLLLKRIFLNLIMSKIFIMSCLISFTWEENTTLVGIVTAIIEFVVL